MHRLLEYIVTKNRNLIHLELNIMLCPYQFSLEGIVHHHENVMHGGHYTTSFNFCEKKKHFIDMMIELRNVLSVTRVTL